MNQFNRELLDSIPEEKIDNAEDFSLFDIRNDIPSLKMRFKAPKKVEVIGSFLLQTGRTDFSEFIYCILQNK